MSKSVDKCFNCNRPGHKSYECHREEKDWEIYCYDSDDLMCSKCGRWNHPTYRCFAKFDIYGNPLNRNYHKHINTSKGITKNKKTK
jgi:hypothetical protein